MIVYDPTAAATGRNVQGWHGWVTPDWERFSRAFWRSRSCVAFIDEASAVFRGPDALNAQAMLTRGRHVNPETGGGGHCVWLISQRFVGFDKTAREQASTGYIFRVGRSDALELADFWGVDELAEAHRLPKLHYFHVDSLGAVQVGRLRF